MEIIGFTILAHEISLLVHHVPLANMENQNPYMGEPTKEKMIRFGDLLSMLE